MAEVTAPQTIEDVKDPRDLDGYELLTPLEQVRPSRAAGIIAALEDLQDAGTSRRVVALIDAIEDTCVTDLDAWIAHYRRVGIESVLELCTSYALKLLGAQS